jgi:copper chaperone
MATTLYSVEGMTCGGCQRHVEKALKGVPGVSTVQVDLAKGTASVEGEASFESLAAALKAEGYALRHPD